MFQNRIIILTAILACFTNQFVPTESKYVINRLRSLAQAVCDFFHPSHKSATPEVINQDLETSPTTTPVYDIDPRLNEDGIPVQSQDVDSGLTRNLNNDNGVCPPGHGKTKTGECRPIYNN